MNATGYEKLGGVIKICHTELGSNLGRVGLLGLRQRDMCGCIQWQRGTLGFILKQRAMWGYFRDRGVFEVLFWEKDMQNFIEIRELVRFYSQTEVSEVYSEAKGYLRFYSEAKGFWGFILRRKVFEVLFWGEGVFEVLFWGERVFEVLFWGERIFEVLFWG